MTLVNNKPVYDFLFQTTPLILFLPEGNFLLHKVGFFQWGQVFYYKTNAAVKLHFSACLLSDVSQVLFA